MFNPTSLKTLVSNGSVSYRENAISYIFSCPKCGKKNKLYIHKDEGFFCCFRCKEDGFKGRSEYALTELYSIPINELKERLYTTTDNKLEKFINLDLNSFFDYEESAEFVEPILPETVLSPNFVDRHHPLFEKGYNYLINERGLTEEHIHIYDIHYSPSEECVVFPVKINNIVVGWQLRHIKQNIKLTNTGLEKEKCLMFNDRLLNSDHCVLAEGPISSIKAHLCGGNVASMGKDVSETQLNIIKNRVSKLYLALDPDATTVIDRICRSLHGELDVNLLMPADGYEDLGKMSQEQVFEQYKKAPSAFGKTSFFFKPMTEFNF
jgi:hypothetical protein